MAMIFDKIIIDNYKCFRHLELDLANELTIIVGDNETGKSTLLRESTSALHKIYLEETLQMNFLHIFSIGSVHQTI